MANIGIISEFNPFHTGHKHLIEKIKGENDTVICVMSGNFVQRGDVAVLNKADRVRAALQNGADLVIELPCPYSLATAQRFAKGSVALLKATGIIDEICFGSESGDISVLLQIAEILSSNKFNEKIASRLKSGDTFAKIRTDLLSEYSKDFAAALQNPNNILGVEYILAAKALSANFGFRTIKRIGAAHDSQSAEKTASASYIREHILKGDLKSVEHFLPSKIDTDNFADIKRLESAILASLRLNNTPERYALLPDISEGIENRIVEAVKTASTLEELFETIKTKRYTLSRIRRIILSAFLGITQEISAISQPYLRILGFTQKGQAALKEIAKTSDLPIICTASDANRLSGDAAELFQLECKASDLWALALNYPQNCGNEYFYKIVKE